MWMTGNGEIDLSQRERRLSQQDKDKIFEEDDDEIGHMNEQTRR
jgi:hypothetical protein